MIAEPLGHVLEATGYLTNGAPAAPSVEILDGDTHNRLPSFRPDVWWRSNADTGRNSTGGLTVYFKYVNSREQARVSEWQQEVWNHGFSPLLWLVSPERVELYNGFGLPQGPENPEANLLGFFRHINAHLAKLDAVAGRLAMETGQFWERERRVNRATSVGDCLLGDLRRLEQALIKEDLDRDDAQGLIGRCIFTKYLIDREIVTPKHLKTACGHGNLVDILDNHHATQRLFMWLRERFNGDMFAEAVDESLTAAHLEHVARFLRREDARTGQLHLFPYRFDVIPVELISAIYEQFVHSAASTSYGTNSAKKEGVYYTPLTVISLVLDEVFEGLSGDETVLDLTCGSGVFLVEALRRLAHLKTKAHKPTRETIRETLYNQVYGIDISEAAVRIAAFSLYLTALELDPEPQPPEALKFEPLRGRTLFVGDAMTIEKTDDGRSALAVGSKLRKFDVIVGNPPWSYKGESATTARRSEASGRSITPRDPSLDFVWRAQDFAHSKTRFGMILKATSFFSRSRTGLKAMHDAIDALAPVTIINLSDLSGWLFPKVGIPGAALLARHRRQPGDRMTLVHARWSQAGERSHTIEITPSDITTLPIASWKRKSGLFKTAFLGRRPDLLLVDELSDKHETLEARLKVMGIAFRNGLTLGKRSNRSRDARFLKNLPIIDKRFARPFSLLNRWSRKFDHDSAQWPRAPEIYRAPLLVVGKFMQGSPRALAGVTVRKAIFTDGYYGASFHGKSLDIAYLLAGILSSGLASWYFFMTGSNFGVWVQGLKVSDVNDLPTPGLQRAVESEPGRQVVRLARTFHQRSPTREDWNALDEAVFDLYGLGDEERIVVRDGLFRAGWQWKGGQDESMHSASVNDLQSYAGAFLSTMDAWLSASNRRRMRAEIYNLTADAPHRIVRFVMENRRGPSVVKVVEPDGPLSSVLADIGERTAVRITEAMVGVRELRVHAKNEVSIIKPAARRHWLGVCGLEDADAVVRDSAYGGRTA